jgi:hypothetical protein
MESVRVFDEFAKLLRVIPIKNLRRSYSLLAIVSKRTEQCAWWKMFGASHAKECLD